MNKKYLVSFIIVLVIIILANIVFYVVRKGYLPVIKAPADQCDEAKLNSKELKMIDAILAKAEGDLDLIKVDRFVDNLQSEYERQKNNFSCAGKNKLRREAQAIIEKFGQAKMECGAQKEFKNSAELLADYLAKDSFDSMADCLLVGNKNKEACENLFSNSIHDVNFYGYYHAWDNLFDLIVYQGRTANVDNCQLLFSDNVQLLDGGVIDVLNKPYCEALISAAKFAQENKAACDVQQCISAVSPAEEIPAKDDVLVSQFDGAAFCNLYCQAANNSLNQTNCPVDNVGIGQKVCKAVAADDIKLCAAQCTESEAREFCPQTGYVKGCVEKWMKDCQSASTFGRKFCQSQFIYIKNLLDKVSDYYQSEDLNTFNFGVADNSLSRADGYCNNYLQYQRKEVIDYYNQKIDKTFGLEQ